jgi:hypothetical protein
MTKDEVLIALCEITSEVYHSVGNYMVSSDGFCPKCEKLQGVSWNFSNSGAVLAFLRDAAREKLSRDGFTPKISEQPSGLLDGITPIGKKEDFFESAPNGSTFFTLEEKEVLAKLI